MEVWGDEWSLSHGARMRVAWARPQGGLLLPPAAPCADVSSRVRPQGRLCRGRPGREWCLKAPSGPVGLAWARLTQLIMREASERA